MKWLKRLFLPVYTRTYPLRGCIIIQTYIGIDIYSQLTILTGGYDLAEKKKEQIDEAEKMRKAVYNC